MMMKKVAVIGGGIVGSVCAYYLARDGYDVTLFDEGTGQATKAAVGIICPWVSQRRNMDWFRLVDEGSIFYHQLIKDLDDSSFYEKSGALLSNDRRLDAMYDLAIKRSLNNPTMGRIEILEGEELKSMLPKGSVCERALYIEGAARVDGALCVDVLNRKSVELGMNLVKEHANFSYESNQYTVNSRSFDSVVLAAGAWLADLLPDYDVDVRPQKGQLIEFSSFLEGSSYPLYIPKGEIDLLYKNDGTLVVGASHEDDMGFDLTPDPRVLNNLQSLGAQHLPSLKTAVYDKVRVGSRAYTSDFLPFYGEVDSLENCFVGSGLGSSGLTSGPIIGFRLAKYVMGKEKAGKTSEYVALKM